MTLNFYSNIGEGGNVISFIFFLKKINYKIINNIKYERKKRR